VLGEATSYHIDLLIPSNVEEYIVDVFFCIEYDCLIFFGCQLLIDSIDIFLALVNAVSDRFARL